MRHKYETRGIVLARSPLGEANALIAILTPEVGLVRARAQGVRRSGAKLAPALATFAESELTLVRGKEQWRVAGAVLKENWFARIKNVSAREHATRVTGLLLRLVAGETSDMNLFPIVSGFFEALAALPEDLHEPAEMLAVIRLLAVLGLDEGSIPGEWSVFAPTTLDEVAQDRAQCITRINRGIAASGL